MCTQPVVRRQVVLVVDDFDDAREMYRDFLELEGYEVVVAVDGREAIARAREVQPDLVLMDLSMPVVDGYDATRALKLDPLTSHIPVVALTGHVMDRHRERAREAGCDTLVPKPCRPTNLADKLRTMLHEAQAHS